MRRCASCKQELVAAISFVLAASGCGFNGARVPVALATDRPHTNTVSSMHCFWLCLENRFGVDVSRPVHNPRVHPLCSTLVEEYGPIDAVVADGSVRSLFCIVRIFLSRFAEKVNVAAETEFRPTWYQVPIGASKQAMRASDEAVVKRKVGKRVQSV